MHTKIEVLGLHVALDAHVFVHNSLIIFVISEMRMVAEIKLFRQHFLIVENYDVTSCRIISSVLVLRSKGLHVVVLAHTLPLSCVMGLGEVLVPYHFDLLKVLVTVLLLHDRLLAF